MFNLNGAVAVVTGASSGIGKAIAIALAQDGADVASFALTTDDIAQTIDEIARTGKRCVAVEGDVGDADAVSDFAQQITLTLGAPNIWVNCAGRLLIRPFLETTHDDWRSLLATNLYGYINGCRTAVTHMLPANYGRIINITSITLQQPILNASAYVSGKGAILGLTKALAVEYAKSGITVNAISPGAIHSRLNADVYSDEVVDVYNDRIPIGRIGQPSDLASAALFLAARESSYVTGQEIVIDGGMTINGDVGLGGTP